ncbi:MAG: caspase family protein [Magnetococcales bacterium]|nr:caspase family protein [Magnetococcales bacterium]
MHSSTLFSVGLMLLVSLTLGLMPSATLAASRPEACPVAREMALKGIDLYDIRPEYGLDALERARVLCPEDGSIGFNLGLALFLEGNKEQARNIWKAVLDEHPDHLDALSNLAWVNFELGDDEAAHLLAFNGLQKFPEFIPLAHTRLYALFRMGRYLEAYDWLVRADLQGLRARRWRTQAAEYVVEALWQRFRRGERMEAIRKAVNLLAREYPDEPGFIAAKDQIVRAEVDPNAEIPYEVLLPHQIWAKTGAIDDGREVLDDFISALPPLSPWQKRSDVFAVMVGIYRYQHLRGRYFADRNANNLFNLLERRGQIINDSNHARLRIDTAATRRVIQRDIEWLLRQGELNPNAVLIFYFSGHGLAWNDENNPTGQDALILPVETKPDEIDPFRAISLSWMKKRFEELPNKNIIVMIDACFRPDQKGCKIAPTLDNSTARLNTGLFESTKGWTMAAISQPAEYHGLGRQGAFTYFLLKGLLGEADTQPVDGWVDFQEAVNYTRKKLGERYPKQDPFLSSPVSLRMTKIGGEK